jgi:hypothetical protein
MVVVSTGGVVVTSIVVVSTGVVFVTSVVVVSTGVVVVSTGLLQRLQLLHK